MIRKKTTHFEEKKALKNTFPQQKNMIMKKSTKNHFCFLKTLAGRTEYRKGVESPLADALSRVTPTPVEEDGIQLPIVAVNLITSKVPVHSRE